MICVDPGEAGSGSGELFGESAIAAAEVEDMFAGLGSKEFDDSRGKSGDETSVGGIGGGVPCLADGWCGRLAHIPIVYYFADLRLCSKEYLIKPPNIPSAAKAALRTNYLRHG